MIHAEQPMPIGTDGPSMHDLVGADLRALAEPGGSLAAAALAQRAQVGLQRYGLPLQAHNGRDAVRDAREEMLDLLVYLKQAIEEGQEGLGELYQEALLLACRLVRRSTNEDRRIGS